MDARSERPILDFFSCFATVPIDAKEPRYRLPLERDAERLAGSVGAGCDVVLLGSIATRKYVDVLEPIFGDRLLFPMEFIGHGDMARGAMLLKRAASGVELTYWPVSEAPNQNSRLRISLKKRSCSCRSFSVASSVGRSERFLSYFLPKPFRPLDFAALAAFFFANAAIFLSSMMGFSWRKCLKGATGREKGKCDSLGSGDVQHLSLFMRE